jgi:hypothetical protein
MSLGCEEVKEACTGKRLRSHDPTPTWIGRSSRGASHVASYVDATGHLPNDRTLNKMRRRSPEAQARNAEMERARKKRLRDGKRKEEAQNVKQALEADGKASGPQLLSGSPPGATAQEEEAQSNLTRGAGYDTTNNMNLFLTQCCGCSNPVRNKKTLFDLLIQQITSLEQHGILDKHQDVQVLGHSVVGVLRLVRQELEDKDPHVSKVPVGPRARPEHPCTRRPALATHLCMLMRTYEPRRQHSALPAPRATILCHVASFSTAPCRHPFPWPALSPPFSRAWPMGGRTHATAPLPCVALGGTIGGTMAPPTLPHMARQCAHPLLPHMAHVHLRVLCTPGLTSQAPMPEAAPSPPRMGQFPSLCTRPTHGPWVAPAPGHTCLPPPPPPSLIDHLARPSDGPQPHTRPILFIPSCPATAIAPLRRMPRPPLPHNDSRTT